MTKAQFISLTTLALFSILLFTYFAFYELNLKFNDLTISSIISEELAYQSQTIFDAVDKALGANYAKFSGLNSSISMSAVLSSGMNPLSNLTSLSSFLSVYKTRITPSMTYSFSELASDLSAGFYERTIIPTYNTVQFNYNDDKIRITNATLVKVYNFTIDCNAPITAINWDNSPSGSDIRINYVHYNGTVSTYTLSSSSNNECVITCGGDDLLITYNFISQDRIEVFYNEFSSLNFGLSLGFNSSYGNVFKISSPYSLTNVTLTYKDYALIRGFE